jgi:AcrR family transcriptional regulator
LTKPVGGRPPNRRIDAALLDATTELLAQVGYSRLTVAEVAHRAGTSMSSLYRRWNSKAAMVFEAAIPACTCVPVDRTNDTAADVRALIASASDVLGTSVVRAALPGLIADMAADPDLKRRMQERLPRHFAALRTLVTQAAGQGGMHSELDPDLLVEIIGGAILWRMLFCPAEPFDDQWVDHLVAIALPHQFASND